MQLRIAEVCARVVARPDSAIPKAGPVPVVDARVRVAPAFAPDELRAPRVGVRVALDVMVGKRLLL